MPGAYPSMMRRDRERLGLRECRAAWLLGLTVREYRALEDGKAMVHDYDTWQAMCDLFGWPQAFYPPRRTPTR